jgi:hypothetical protein
MVLAQTQTARTARTFRKAERISFTGSSKDKRQTLSPKRKLYVLNVTANRVSEIDL